MKKFLEQYKIGLDFWALVLFALIMLPNIVYWCIPAFSDLDVNSATDTAARVFQVIGVALLLFLVQKPQEKKQASEKKPFFDSLFMMVTLLLLLYYAAWIIYFCGTLNVAILLFLAGCPCIALALFALERRNFFALVPLIVFSVLHIVATLQIVVF